MVWIATVVVGDRPTHESDPVIILGDNTAARARVNRCSGARDPRAAALMRLLGAIEIRGVWSHCAYYIASTDDVLADGSHDGSVAISHRNCSPLLRLNRSRNRAWAG